MKLLKIFIVFALITSSCSKKDKKELEDLKLYQTAIEQIQKKRFSSAQENLIELENEFPYSDYAAKAEALNSFISYVTEDYQESYDLAEKFIKLRPANDHIEYMYFLKSISILELVKDRYRESETAIKTQRSFRELNTRFPESIYKQIADTELNKLKNIIASHELEIARYYQFHQDFLPAILRYQKIVKEFPSSNYVTESHFRLAECYYSLGLVTEAQRHLKKVLNIEEDSKWTDHAKNLKQIITSSS